YSEFVLLYRLLHRSRLPQGAADAHECWLEKYYQQGIDEGGRVREHLRDGVEAALKQLGSAFLAHPESGALRQALREGRLDAQGYYRQLLRLVYRLLFLFVVEERRLVFPPAVEHADRQGIYTSYYSLSRLRDRCERYFAEDRHADLWQGLLQTFWLFRDADAGRQLGLSALDGELFGGPACADLERAACENARLLRALYHLSTFADGSVRRRVNYAGLDVEELGSVYESLLDYRPHVELDGEPGFELLAGGERKQTGSYYTPPELVRELIDHALVPVIEERLAGTKTREEKEAALLGLRVCDPASGSGHFLLAAARRIARELAKVRSGEDEPTPEAFRGAVRDVIRTCIYAVDKNPLAVDLCKVALWLEGHNAGLPLSFLDHHVKWGDSLVGVFDLKVLAEGIPDEAYNRSDREEKAAAAHYKKRNREERKGQQRLDSYAAVSETPAGLAGDFQALATLAERTPADVQAKQELYESLRSRGSTWWTLRVACDLWTAAFFTGLRLPKDGGADMAPTTDTVRQYVAHPGAGYGPLVGEAVALSERHAFFHWPLEFPEVFAAGGFDVVLGNPPFMGGLKISERLGDCYRSYLHAVFAPAGGLADLCAYFYRRGYGLLWRRGDLGMVATNTIGQGDTREAGLAVVVGESGVIAFARRFIKWPGVANVEVNLVAVRKGPTDGQCELDGDAVACISSRLDAEPEGEVRTLRRNHNRAFQGSNVLGTGFMLSPDEALNLATVDPRNRDCLYPFLTGDDLNSRPDQSPSRWVINFRDWELDRAEMYADCMKIVRERVKPQHDRLATGDATARERARHWWQFTRPTLDLYAAVNAFPRVLVRARVSETHALAFVDKGWVYSEQTIVFAFPDDYHFALLQSGVHEAWVRRNASTMRTDVRYTPSDCFDTFPFPQELPSPDKDRAGWLGGEYHEHRRQVMLRRNLGLTKTYNLFHNPECRDADIQRVRELHAEMDRAILACYGWQDVDPGHGFHQNERGQTRYTVSAEARREILTRLLELNLRLAAEEEAGGKAVKQSHR
ncbi:MAG: N-6 DNA methylase, partial [Armatimonadetes bacterium]|nr:N-6 DNA methylase [Armatimonadota bacterium]